MGVDGVQWVRKTGRVDLRSRERERERGQKSRRGGDDLLRRRDQESEGERSALRLPDETTSPSSHPIARGNADAGVPVRLEPPRGLKGAELSNLLAIRTRRYPTTLGGSIRVDVESCHWSSKVLEGPARASSAMAVHGICLPLILLPATLLSSSRIPEG